MVGPGIQQAPMMVKLVPCACASSISCTASPWPPLHKPYCLYCNVVLLPPAVPGGDRDGAV